MSALVTKKIDHSNKLRLQNVNLLGTKHLKLNIKILTYLLMTSLSEKKT